MNLFVDLKGNFDSDFNLPQGQLWVLPDSSVEGHLHELGKIPLDEAIKVLQPTYIGVVFIRSSSCKDSSSKNDHPGRTTFKIMTSEPYKWCKKYAPEQILLMVPLIWEGSLCLGPTVRSSR